MAHVVAAAVLFGCSLLAALARFVAVRRRSRAAEPESGSHAPSPEQLSASLDAADAAIDDARLAARRSRADRVVVTVNDVVARLRDALGGDAPPRVLAAAALRTRLRTRAGGDRIVTDAYDGTGRHPGPRSAERPGPR